MFKKLNLFGQKPNNEVIVSQEKVVTKGKTVNEIIDEIHESFYTEVDKLLADAKILKSKETTKQSIIEKRDRLVKLGFSQTKECAEANAEIKRLSNIESENQNKQHLESAIEYFSVKYPQYKFITEESVKKICSKYNLIYGGVNRYKGDVPDKNLKQIENFRISEEDKVYVKSVSYGFSLPSEESLVPYSEYAKYLPENSDDFRNIHALMMRGVSYTCASLEIAAPLKDFDMRGMEIKGFELSKIETPDPVVLQPVLYEGKKHYLIVTAWGQEASDENVVNQKMN